MRSFRGMPVVDIGPGISGTFAAVVYNVLFFALAFMMATTVFLMFNSFAVQAKYQSAVIVHILVTFIAAYR